MFASARNMHEEADFHAAVGNGVWAAIGDGKRSTIVDTQGLMGNEDRTFHMHMLETLEFEQGMVSLAGHVPSWAINTFG